MFSRGKDLKLHMLLSQANHKSKPICGNKSRFSHKPAFSISLVVNTQPNSSKNDVDFLRQRSMRENLFRLVSVDEN